MVNKKELNKIGNKLTGFFKSFKFWATPISILAGILLTLYCFIQISKWYDKNQVIFQSPVIIKIQPPILIKEREPSKKIEIKVEQLINDKKTTNTIKGEASHYNSKGCLGCSETLTMANGEKLDDNALTLALTPETVKAFKLMNKNVVVKNLANDREVIAKVSDTGGFGSLDRIADLTDATRDAIGCGGLCQVEIRF